MEVKKQLVVRAFYTLQSSFRIPKGIDLDDKTVVREFFVKYNTLHIVLVNGKVIEREPCYSDIDVHDFKYPVSTDIDEAEDYEIRDGNEDEYDNDEDDEDPTPL
jgi:hypothetical protein